MVQTESSSHVVFVNELNFEREVLGATMPVLIDVSADWCAPCKAAAPVIAELAARHAGSLKVVAIDGGESPGLTARFGVRGFPTFIGMIRGDVMERRAGFAGKRALEQLATDLLSQNTYRAP